MEHGTWTRDRDRVWSSTQEQASADVWPQGASLCVPEDGLYVSACGGGGGAQEALFRRELTTLLASGHHAWRARAPNVRPPLTEDLAAFFEETRARFEQIEGPDADQYQATIVAALFRHGAVALCHQGLERAYVKRGHTLTRATRDHTIARAEGIEDAVHAERMAALAAGGPAPQTSLQLLGRLGASFFGRGMARVQAEVTEREVAPGDLVLLVTTVGELGISDLALSRAIDAALAHTPLEAAARALHESLDAHAHACDDMRARFLVRARNVCTFVRV